MSEDAKSSGNPLAALIVLPLLLVLPVLAGYRGLGPTWSTYLGGWGTAVSLLTLGLYYADKRRAEKNGPRTPETVLHLLELIGGWPGAFLAQRWVRHKSSKVIYQVVFWFIVLGYEAVAIDWLLGWPMAAAIAGNR